MSDERVGAAPNRRGMGWRSVIPVLAVIVLILVVLSATR